MIYILNGDTKLKKKWNALHGTIDTTTYVDHWTVVTSIITKFQLDTNLNLYCNKTYDTEFICVVRTATRGQRTFCFQLKKAIDTYSMLKNYLLLTLFLC